MSNHFTGLKLGPPEGDTRLDLTDLYVFTSPADATRTAVILNCNSFTQGGGIPPRRGLPHQHRQRPRLRK
jgi:hypothetical protein